MTWCNAIGWFSGAKKQSEENVVLCSAAVCGGGAQSVVTTKAAARRLVGTPSGQTWKCQSRPSPKIWLAVHVTSKVLCTAPAWRCCMCHTLPRSTFPPFCDRCVAAKCTVSLPAIVLTWVFISSLARAISKAFVSVKSCCWSKRFRSLSSLTPRTMRSRIIMFSLVAKSHCRASVRNLVTKVSMRSAPWNKLWNL